MKLSFCLLPLFLSACVCSARADSVIVGPSNGSVNLYPFGTDLYRGEYQQAYSASAFSGPVTISALTFFATSGSITGDYRLSLSTTTESLDGLSTNYASNLGADDTLFTATPVKGVLTFTGTPFEYNPALGNLLLNVIVLTSNPSFANLESGCSSQTARVYNNGGDGAPVAVGPSACASSSNSDGLLTQFTTEAVTPEPGSLLLFGSGALGMLGVLRRKAQA